MTKLIVEAHHRIDDEKIFDLQQYVYPNHHLFKDRNLTRKYWQWRYFSHPNINSQIFIMRDEKNGVIAGMRPVTFLPIQLNGQQVLTAWLTAVITHPQYRRMGIFSRLVKNTMSVARQRGAKFAFTFPNEKSFAIYKKKTEWRYISAIPLYVKVLRPLLCIRMGMATVPLLRHYLKFNTKNISIHSDSSTKIHHDCEDFKIVTANRVSSDYDRLWKNVSGGFKIAVQRDAAYLNWRYFQNPIFDYILFEARRKTDNALIGYLVVNITVRESMVIGLIVDMVAENEASAVIRALIRVANYHLKSSGVAVAACLMNKNRYYANSLVRCGYIPVPNCITPKKFHTICSNLTDDSDFGNFIADFDNWYLTWGDTDNV